MLYRAARPQDATRLAEIYALFVDRTAITFATTPPTQEEFQHRIASPFPFLVCEEAGCVLGFAYAGPFRVKEAFRWDTELTIYVDPSAHSRGIGKALMQRLLELLRAQGYQNAYSCITLPNEKSIGLHQRFGFQQIGLFEKAGYKLGQWHSVAWLHLPLGTFPEEPREPLPFDQLPEDFLKKVLDRR